MKPLLIALDFDGTLTRIRKRPQDAVLSPSMRRLLKKIKKKYPLAIWSGRGLTQLKKKINIRGLFYAGNHGLEIAGPGFTFTHPAARRRRKLINQLFTKLSAKLKKIPSIIENKRYSISVHYRITPAHQLAALKKIFYNITGPLARRRQIAVKGGKKVLEVLPPLKWHKGHALKLLQQHLGNIPVLYLGDDLTDEDVFRSLSKKDRGIFVGRPRSKTFAKEHLTGIPAVRKLLKSLVK